MRWAVESVSKKIGSTHECAAIKIRNNKLAFTFILLPGLKEFYKKGVGNGQKSILLFACFSA